VFRDSAPKSITRGRRGEQSTEKKNVGEGEGNGSDKKPTRDLEPGQEGGKKTTSERLYTVSTNTGAPSQPVSNRGVEQGGSRGLKGCF